MHGHGKTSTDEVPNARGWGAVKDSRSYSLLTDAKTSVLFRMMTFPAYRSFLDFNSSNIAPLAIGVYENGSAVGLALLCTDAGSDETTLLSIFVSSRFRRRGIALELMQKTLTHCEKNGIRHISASYMTGQNSTQALENIFNKTCWTIPQTRMMVMHASLESIKTAPWFTRRKRLPASHEVLPWAQVTVAERALISVSNSQETWIDPNFSPFDLEESFEPNTSVALRVNGVIVGWLLTHAINGNLRLTGLFIKQNLRSSGGMFLLLDAVIALMPEAGFSVAMWVILSSNKNMVDFVCKQVQPYTIFSGETRGVTIQLDNYNKVSGQ